MIIFDVPPGGPRPGMRPGGRRQPWEHFEKDSEKRLRDLPKIIGAATRLAWEADRPSFVVTAAVDLFIGLTAGAQVLVAQRAAQRLLGAPTPAEAVRAALPSLIVALALTSATRLLRIATDVRRELFAERVQRASTRRLLEAVNNVELLAFDDPTFYDRLQRAQMGSMRAAQVVQGLVSVSVALFSIVGFIVALAAIQPLLVLVLLLGLIPLWAVTRRNSRERVRFMRFMTPTDRQRSMLVGLLSSRDAAKEVRAFGLEDELVRRYDRLSEERLAELRMMARKQVRRQVWAQASTVLLTVGAGVALLWMYRTERMDLAAMVASFTALRGISQRAEQGLNWGVRMLFESALYLEDNEAFIDIAKTYRAARPTGTAPASFDRLAVEHVSFTYPAGEKPALDDVSLEIERGEVIALVGENGSGKTTLAKLLANLYRPTAGRVAWDGIDIATLDPTILRDHVTVLFQDFVHFPLSVHDNVAFGDVTRLDDRAAVEAAAERSDADGFVRRLPEGYDTMLGPLFTGGHELSGGQWQKVAVARAFFRDAPLLILDEPTAALDARAEHALFERIRELFRGRTVVLISHRFSTVRQADRIYVMHLGRIVEHGSHAELMTRKGTYADLYTLQASAFTDQPSGEPSSSVVDDDLGPQLSSRERPGVQIDVRVAAVEQRDEI